MWLEERIVINLFFKQPVIMNVDQLRKYVFDYVRIDVLMLVQWIIVRRR